MEFVSAGWWKTRRNDIPGNSASAPTFSAPDMTTGKDALFKSILFFTNYCVLTPWGFLSGRLCGGRGRCECNLCVCDEGWGGDDCSCYLGSDTCMAKNQQVCNGRGYCQCGTCVCHGPRYFGPTCEICPMCVGVCQQKAECVECLAFGTGPKKAV